MNAIATEEVSTVNSLADSQPTGSPSEPKQGPSIGGASLTEKIGIKDRKVFAIFLISASLLVIARIVAPFEVGKDQACQLEAAQRLVNGLGLTSTDFDQTSPDVTEPVRAGYLTWFPPGFSLLVASLLYMNLPLLLTQKLIYGVVTLAGWVGWALIAGRFLSRAIRVGSRSYPVQFVLAALIPVFTTLQWQGTDILLWAGIPFVVLLLVKSTVSQPGYIFVSAAGLLCGSLYSVRYASSFLCLAAMLILIQVSLPNVKLLFKRAIVLVFSQLIIILPTLVYTRLFSQHGSFLPQYVDPVSNYARIPTKLFWMLEGSSIMSNLVFGVPLIHQLSLKLGSSLLNRTLGVTCLLVIFSLPLIILKSRTPKTAVRQTDIALSFSFLLISLVVMLVAANFTSGQGLFYVRRYYTPLALCSFFIFYELASIKTTNRIIKLASTAIASTFVLYILVFMPAMSFLPSRRGELVGQVLSFTPPKQTDLKGSGTSRKISYPNYIMYSRKENSRLKIKELHQANPEAIFLVGGNYLYYVYDELKGGPIPGLNLKRFPKDREYLMRAYTSRPIRVFWVLDYPIVARDKKILTFIPASNLREVFVDRSEKTLILESDFPAGHSLSPLTAVR